MKFARRRRGRVGAVVELTPLIDVVLLLLIFFMVSTTFRRESVLSVELPVAEGGTEATNEAMQVTVDAAGNVAVDGEPLPDGEFATVRDAILAAVRRHADESNAALDSAPAVIVVADAASRHDAVLRVLDAIGASGLSDVQILAQEPSSAGDG